MAPIELMFLEQGTCLPGEETAAAYVPFFRGGRLRRAALYLRVPRAVTVTQGSCIRNCSRLLSDIHYRHALLTERTVIRPRSSFVRVSPGTNGRVVCGGIAAPLLRFRVDLL